jgi:Gpi18-like mannosyltransferase
MLQQIIPLFNRFNTFIENKKILSVVLLFFATFVFRLIFFNVLTSDYKHCLSLWYDYIVANGGYHSWKDPFHDYPMSYIYLLTIITHVPLPKLYAVKLLSVVFDYIAAYIIFKIVRLKYKDRFGIPIMASILFLFTPTVFLNSAAWGQCDIIYTTFLLVSTYYCLKQKHIPAILFFGIAFTFKVQAVFFSPILLVLWFQKRFNILYFFLIPAVYFISILPAYFAGRGMVDLLTIYGMQFDTYPKLNMAAPNFYSWISNSYYNFFVPAGMSLTFILVCTSIYFIIRQSKEISTQRWIEIFLFFLMLIPFMMPKMHDRYFFSADVLSILYLFYYPKRYYITLFALMGSLLVYPPLHVTPKIAMVFTLLALIYTARFLFYPKKTVTQFTNHETVI